MGGRVGEATAAHRSRRRYYFADPAEVARRVYFPRPGYFRLLFYRERKQNNRPERTQAAGWARVAAAACRGKTGSAPARPGRARRSPDCELGGSGASGPSPPLLSPRVPRDRSRASRFSARLRPPGPAPLPLGRRRSHAGGVGLRPPPSRCQAGRASRAQAARQAYKINVGTGSP